MIESFLQSGLTKEQAADLVEEKFDPGGFRLSRSGSDELRKERESQAFRP